MRVTGKLDVKVEVEAEVAEQDVVEVAIIERSPTGALL
jgi:hypothetical protein